MSNCFGFRYVREGIQYRGEYRLAHWSGWRQIRDHTGEIVPFSHATDAALAAAKQLVEDLNGNASFWRGRTGDEAREAAEKYFTRATDGESSSQTEA